jgi:putative membrane protein
MVARGLWIWNEGGGYFGIPWVNFAGWWLSAASLTLIVRPDSLPRRPLLVIYTLTWLFQALGLGLFWGQPGPALIGLLVMGAFTYLAWKAERHPWTS